MPSRRSVILGSGALAITGMAAMLARPAERGGMHEAYFAGLSAALKRAGLMRPTLVIDRERLVANTAAIRGSTAAAGLRLRIVAKSLPCPQLIEMIMQSVSTNRLMVFSADMLLQLLPLRPKADYLMGKPLPVSEFVRVADKAGGEAAAQVQWLIDTPARLTQYREAATARKIPLTVSFEIDVGLHRGGFTDPKALAETLRQALAAQVRIGGLMGYDPHVLKMPSADKAWAAAQSAYGTMIEVLRAGGLTDPAALTLNSAGSPTFRRHCAGTVANEVSVGSAFVKPGDFDYDDLADLLPAAFIATPVIKACADQALPGVEALSGAMHWWDRNTQRGFFIHGGHWLAKPVSPPGLEYSKLFGRSSNQELLTGSKLVSLKPDDHVFLRPDQSEALFLQFGDIAVFDGLSIAKTWPILPISA